MSQEEFSKLFRFGKVFTQKFSEQTQNDRKLLCLNQAEGMFDRAEKLLKQIDDPIFKFTQKLELYKEYIIISYARTTIYKKLNDRKLEEENYENIILYYDMHTRLLFNADKFLRRQYQENCKDSELTYEVGRYIAYVNLGKIPRALSSLSDIVKNLYLYKAKEQDYISTGIDTKFNLDSWYSQILSNLSLLKPSELGNPVKQSFLNIIKSCDLVLKLKADKLRVNDIQFYCALYYFATIYFCRIGKLKDALHSINNLNLIIHKIPQDDLQTSSRHFLLKLNPESIAGLKLMQTIIKTAEGSANGNFNKLKEKLSGSLGVQLWKISHNELDGVEQDLDNIIANALLFKMKDLYFDANVAVARLRLSERAYQSALDYTLTALAYNIEMPIDKKVAVYKLQVELYSNLNLQDEADAVRELLVGLTKTKKKKSVAKSRPQSSSERDYIGSCELDVEEQILSDDEDEFPECYLSSAFAQSGQEKFSKVKIFRPRPQSPRLAVNSSTADFAELQQIQDLQTRLFKEALFFFRHNNYRLAYDKYSLLNNLAAESSNNELHLKAMLGKSESLCKLAIKSALKENYHDSLSAYQDAIAEVKSADEKLNAILTIDQQQEMIGSESVEDLKLCIDIMQEDLSRRLAKLQDRLTKFMLKKSQFVAAKRLKKYFITMQGKHRPENYGKKSRETLAVESSVQTIQACKLFLKNLEQMQTVLQANQTNVEEDVATPNLKKYRVFTEDSEYLELFIQANKSLGFKYVTTSETSGSQIKRSGSLDDLQTTKIDPLMPRLYG